jgi:hypothetical protein
MTSNNYGVKIEVVGVGMILQTWDFSKPHHVLSVSKSTTPNLQDIEECGVVIAGSAVKQRLEQFAKVSTYDFGNGNIGLCLLDTHENHYFVSQTKEEVAT